MAKWAGERWAAAAGVVFVVLSLVGDFAPGASYPKINDSPATIAAYFHDHHRGVLVGAILTGLASPFLIWMFAGIAVRMRNMGQGGLAVVAFGAAVAGTAMGAANDAIGQSLTRVQDDTFIKAAFATQGFVVTKAFWFAAIGALVIGLAAWRGAFAMWYAWLTFLAGVFFVLGGLAIGASGFFGTGGAMAFIAFIALAVWVLASSFVLWTLPAAEPAHMPVTSPM